MAQVCASQAARAAGRAGVTNGGLPTLFAYFGSGLGLAAGLGYARYQPEKALWMQRGDSHSPIKQLRENRKSGYRSMHIGRGIPEHLVTSMNGEMPERFHHMRTGRTKLMRSQSRSPNVPRLEKRKSEVAAARLERLNSKTEKAKLAEQEARRARAEAVRA